MSEADPDMNAWQCPLALCGHRCSCGGRNASHPQPPKDRADETRPCNAAVGSDSLVNTASPVGVNPAQDSSAPTSLGERLVRECIVAMANVDIAPLLGYWNAAALAALVGETA